MTETTELLRRIDLIESRTAIEEVLHGYAQAFDYKNVELLKSLFHRDGVIDLGPAFGKSEGIDAILAGAEKLWERMPQMHHWMSNPIIKIDGDRATATSNIHGVMFVKSDGPAEVAGFYRDDFERRDRRWAIALRRFEAHYWVPLQNWTPAA